MYLSRASSACREGAAPAAGQLAVAAAAGRRGRPAIHGGRRADAAQPRGAAWAALAPQQVRHGALPLGARWWTLVLAALPLDVEAARTSNLLGALWRKLVLAAPSLDLEVARTSNLLLDIHLVFRTRRKYPPLGECSDQGNVLNLLPC